MSTETPDKPKTEAYLGITDYKVIGKRPIRHDGADKVTGKAIYTADFKLPGMLHGAILRSPHPHAKIKSIDTSEAEAMEGVMAVVTAADMPGLHDKVANLGEGAVNLLDLGSNVLAHEKVLYRGHAVAAVAAKTVHIAQEALKKIKVEYEELPAVTWVLDAMKEDAPILLDRVRTDDMGKMSEEPTNVAKHIRFEKGDIEDGFSKCDLVIEREFRTETVHQGYIEPHASVAMWNEDGHLKVWTATQGSFTARQQTAELLDLPVSQVTVTPCEIGGGFGGKIAVYTEPVAAMLSKKSGRPVKVTMQRNEVFEGTGPTPGSYMKVKLGATNDGKLVAGEAWLAYDAGAFPGGVIGPGCMCVFSCYDLEHAKVDGYDVLLNKPKTQAYRAPGSTHVAFAVETIVDEIAEKLEMDPIDFRIQNAAKEGTVRVDGLKYPRIGLVETLEAVKNSEHYQSTLEGPNKGRGVACGFWFNIGLKSSVTATVNPDGRVNLVEGSTDIGGTRTSIAMQFAETLGISAEDVIPQVANTDSIGYTDVTGGSRVTFSTGLAAYKCALDIQDQLRARAADLWECEPEQVIVDGDTYSHNGESLTFKDLAEKASKEGDPVVGSATVSPDCFTNGFAAHLADVEVDPETGKVTILRYTAVQDAGKAIHPSYVEGQMQGGAVQGIGWALNEEYFYDDKGNMKNASYLDYRMPTCLDVPMIETIIVEVPNPDHPYGVRGVGEPPICPPPAAIANAIYHATGVRMRELPMSPPKLWKAISERNA
ncbi:MAG: xanthine dehydrogenase family protein molybdopterin-binding subunit [Planctomycetaceae bacterium]|nr:xanthine dehydrogenase family protein molybdopterin-binding subunit [Planctomycetaceae bacterium]